MQPTPEPIRLDSCTSTMDEAKQRARDGAPDGTLIVSKQMTGGRGTHGRPWHAPEGGLYLSVILRDLQDPHLLTLALGNAVAEALEVAGIEPQLKWVNDVLVDDRKIAGILVEGEATGDTFDFLVAGIGINVNGKQSDFPSELRETSATLQQELGAEQCIEDLEALLLDEIRRGMEKVRGRRADEILRAWRARDAMKGRKVRVDTGDQTIAGTADGIDDHGHLRVVQPSGEVATLQAGTVTLA